MANNPNEDARFQTRDVQFLGQIVKSAEQLEPSVFPYSVDISGSRLETDLSALYVGDSIGGVPFSERGASVAITDVGEIVLNQVMVDQGNTSSVGITEFLRAAKLKLPPGWRCVGFAHSHPMIDVVNFAISKISNKVANTLSSGDVDSFMSCALAGFNCFVVVTPMQIFLITATKNTKAMLNRSYLEKYLQNNPDRHGNPDLDALKELDAVMYVTNRRTGNGILERVL